MMHGHEKSDSAIVAMKPPNNAGPAAEAVERRAGPRRTRTDAARAGHRAGKRVPGAGARTEGREASRQSSEVGAVCTKAARTNELCAQLHNRMPVVLAPEAWPQWLGEEPADEAQLKSLLVPYPSDGMVCWPVSERVGSVKNNDPSLVEPVVLP